MPLDRRFIMTRVVVILHLLFGIIHGTNAIWPLPRSMSSGPQSSFLRLDPSFRISLSTESALGPALSASAPQDLLDAINRTSVRLWTDNLERLVVGRGSGDLTSIRSAPALESLVLSIISQSSVVNSIAEEARKPPEEKNEIYNLTMPSDGSPATLEAQTTLGLLRGLTTFEQMWYSASDRDGDETYSFGVPVEIRDEPAFVSL